MHRQCFIGRPHSSGRKRRVAHVTPSLRPSAKPFADGGGLFFVAGLVEQRKHIAFVVLDTGLIERIDSENVSRDTARLLKKVKQLADVVLVDGGNGYANIGHTTIYMGKSRAASAILLTWSICRSAM